MYSLVYHTLQQETVMLNTQRTVRNVAEE